MIKLAQALVNKSVFRRIPPGTTMNEILAVCFHRFAATIYLFYVLWAVVSLVDGIPSIISTQGDLFQVIFSSLVLITAIGACIGVVFWPKLARMELFASTSFSGLVVIYLYNVLMALLDGTSKNWATFILIFSLLVLPVCRIVIMIIFLLRQAKMTREG